jgi:fructokinase
VIVVCGEALIALVPSGDGIQRPRPGAGRSTRLERLPGCESQQHSSSACPRMRSVTSSSICSARTALPCRWPISVPSPSRSRSPRSTATASRRIGSSSTEHRPATPPSLSPDVNALHVGTLGLLLEPMASTLADFIQPESEQRVVMLDPNIRPALVANAGEYRRRLDAVIARSTIVKGSDADLSWLYPDLDLEAAVDRILGAGVRIVVATLGAGALSASNSVRVRVPAPTVEVVDTMGAGDFFDAALLAVLHDDWALGTDVVLGADELKSALVFACLVASWTCTRAGAEPPWRAELGDDLAGSLGTSYK